MGKDKGVEREVRYDRVVAWINEHWKGDKLCPICNNDSWGIFNRFAELRPFGGGGLAIGGPILPLVILTCNKCGHTLQFNAIIMGLIEQHPGTEEPERFKPDKTEKDK